MKKKIITAKGKYIVKLVDQPLKKTTMKVKRQVKNILRQLNKVTQLFKIYGKQQKQF